MCGRVCVLFDFLGVMGREGVWGRGSWKVVGVGVWGSEEMEDGISDWRSLCDNLLYALCYEIVLSSFWSELVAYWSEHDLHQPS